jgi:hypothetical protein
MPAHEGLRADNRDGLEDRRKPPIQLNEKQTVTVLELDAATHPPPQYEQLMSERLVARSVRDRLNQSAKIEDAVLINTHVARIKVQSDQLVIELTNAKGIGSKRSHGRKMLKVPWRKTPLRRRREILVPASVRPQEARPMRAPRTVPSSSPRLPAAVAGSMSSSPIQTQMLKASRPEMAAACARST